MHMMRNAMIATVGLVALAMPAIAQAPVRSERVQFARGTASKVIKASLKGYDMVDYLVGARAGQTMNVTFRTSNASSYFNILAPGSGDSAMFVGSTAGNYFSGRLPASGDYRIRVYLMRNAARRNEVANYTLTLSVAALAATAAQVMPAATGPALTPGNMPAYCRGEASSQYGTRPTYVKTGAIAKAPGGFQIDGTVDKGSEGIKRFRCRFDAQRRFVDVMAMTPDGK